MNTNFFVKGTIKDLPIFVYVENDMFEFPLKNTDELVKYCEKSKYGMGKQHVLDENYRKAFSLTSDKFVTSFNPYNHKELIVEINKLFITHNFLVLDKINIYEKEGFFRVHKDTPKPGLLGTLVVSLPSEFTGGELEIDKEPIQMNSETDVTWVAFFSERDHQVLPVKDGTRITLTYSIYSNGLDRDIKLDGDTYKLIHSVPDKKFEKLAYGCDNMSVSKFTIKGTDSELFEWLRNNGLNPTIESFYKHRCNGYGYTECWDEFDSDGYCTDFVDECLNDVLVSKYGDNYRPDENTYIITDKYYYENKKSKSGNNISSPIYQDDVKFIRNLKMIKESKCKKIYKNVERDSYGNEPYNDDCLYHEYYIVFDNPALRKGGSSD